MELGTQQISYAACLEDAIPDGIFVFGLVQRVREGDQIHHAILDGGWWSHPVLMVFDGQDVALNLNLSAKRLEVLRSILDRTVLAVLDVEPVSEPIALFGWLMTNPGKAVDFRRLLRTRRIPLMDMLFAEVPDGVIIAEGVVQFTVGGHNGLGGDAEVINHHNYWFYVRQPPSILQQYVGKPVIVTKQRGRLVVVEAAVGQSSV